MPRKLQIQITEHYTTSLNVHIFNNNGLKAQNANVYILNMTKKKTYLSVERNQIGWLIDLMHMAVLTKALYINQTIAHYKLCHFCIQKANILPLYSNLSAKKHLLYEVGIYQCCKIIKVHVTVSD